VKHASDLERQRWAVIVADLNLSERRARRVGIANAEQGRRYRVGRFRSQLTSMAAVQTTLDIMADSRAD